MVKPLDLPPELQQELKKIEDLPEKDAVAEAMRAHAHVATLRSQGKLKGMTAQLNSAMIASDDLHSAERLARAYAESLRVQGLVEQDKVRALDWETIFDGAKSADLYAVATDRIDSALKAAEGGVLIISAPYKCPFTMSEHEFALANYSAIRHLHDRMDETSDVFDKAFDDLYDAGKDLKQMQRQMQAMTFENPLKPVILLIGTPEEMQRLVNEDPYPWDSRFSQKIGIKEPADEVYIYGLDPNSGPPPPKAKPPKMPS